jgi:glycosyltransferase involved in cell wall biosynthesis
MDSDVRVSIMMITYNHEKYIRKALDSVVAQRTNFAFEAIVGDDYSTDGTRDIIREYARKYPKIIKPVFRDRNLGASKNVVSVLRKCKAEYVAYLEGDDFWIDEYKLQKQVDYLDSHKESAGVMTGVSVVDRYDSPMVTGPKLLDHELCTPLEYVKTMYPYNQFKFIGSLMTRNLWLDGQYEKYFLQTEIVTDQIIGAIVVQNGKLGYLDDITAAYRWVPSHGNNYSSMPRIPMCHDRIKSFETVITMYPPETYKWLYMRISRDNWQILHGLLAQKQIKELLTEWFVNMNLYEKFFYVIYYVIRKKTGVF